MPQAPFSQVLPSIEKILGDPELPPEVKARFSDELLAKSGWDKADFSRNYKMMNAKVEEAGTTGTLQDSIVKGLTFNLDDEIRSGLGAATDMLKGEGFGESYNKRMDLSKIVEERRGQKNPAAQIGGELLGAVISPLSTVGQGGGLLTRLGAGTTAGAVSGAADEQGGERLGGGLYGGAFGALGQGIAEGLGGAIRSFASPAGDAAGAAMERQGIPPTGGMVGGPTVRALDATLRNVPVASDVMATASERTAQGVEDLHGRIGAALAAPTRPGATTKQAAGDLAKTVARETGTGVDAHVETLLNDLVTTVGGNTPSNLAPLVKLHKELLAEKARAPRSLSSKLDVPINELNQILADAGPSGVLPYEVLRKVRTEIGKKLKDPSSATGYSGGSAAVMRRVYGTLKDSLIRTAEATSPEAASKAKAFDRFVTRFNQGSDPNYPAPVKILEKIIDSKTDEQAWSVLQNQSPKALDQLRRNVHAFGGRDGWEAIAASVWNNLGHAKPGVAAAGDDFSMQSFLTNWNKLDPAVRRQFFRGTRFQGVQNDIDDLVAITQQARQVDQAGNPSGTGRMLTNVAVMGGLGAAIVPALMGNVGPLAGAAAGVATPYLSAKVLTSPRALRILTRMGRARNQQTLAPMFAQLRNVLDTDDQEGLDRFLTEQEMGGGTP